MNRVNSQYHCNVLRRRIGKDLFFRWTITTNGSPIPLTGRNLTLVLSGECRRAQLEYEIDSLDECTIMFVLRGREQRETGFYQVSLWENYGKNGQTVVDAIAVELVRHSWEESRHDKDYGLPNLDVGDVILSTADLELGPRGADGVSVVDIHQVVVAESSSEPNVIRVTLSNGKTFDFEVRNGSGYILTDADRDEIMHMAAPQSIPNEDIDELFDQ